ncbi:hypothetical protein [Paenibacillus woosongensis]|uniref:Uncharacterized protein n=1 Tax=Paenibacillus woosongensis TaxID=307580 RepID=A0ABQ4MXY0_9BACL|nr:hypothetical protein [Paenibacillus woosongensis]GIP60801.1 hypothetical protein J15TS10_46150 [Paenibacillus woosongensis]
MKDLVFKHYQNKVRAHALVYKHIKKQYYFINTMAILCPAIILTCIYIFVFKEGSGLWLFISSIASIAAFLYSGFSFSNAAKKVIRKRYKISIGKGTWRTERFKELQSSKLADFLHSKDLKTRWKIEKLIELYKNDRENSKLPPLIAPSLFLAVLTPNLTQFLFYIYKDKELMPPYEVMELFLGSTLLSVAVIVVLTFYKRVKDSIDNDIFQNKNNIREGLIQQLEDLLLRMPDEREKGQAKDVIKLKEDTGYNGLHR